MPRPRKPARLHLRPARKRNPTAIWVIIYGEKEISTGASEAERGKAEEALANYVADRHRPPSGSNAPTQLLCSEVLSAYLDEHAPTVKSAAWIADMAQDVLA